MKTHNRTQRETIGNTMTPTMMADIVLRATQIHRESYLGLPGCYATSESRAIQRALREHEDAIVDSAQWVPFILAVMRNVHAMDHAGELLDKLAE